MEKDGIHIAQADGECPQDVALVGDCGLYGAPALKVNGGKLVMPSGKKIGIFVVALVLFAVLFFLLDSGLQTYQGLTLFPSDG